MADKGEKVERVTDIFLGSKITAHVYCSHEIKRCLLLGRKAVTNLDSILKSRKKSRDITLLTQVHIVKAIVFPVVMYRCESWTMKKVEHQRIDACKLWCWKRFLRISWEIKPVNPKGNQPWIFIGRTDAEAEASILWPPDMKSRLTGKGIDAGKDWRQEEKGATEDETVGWHHRFNAHELEQTPGESRGQKSLSCCSLWGHKELAMT